MHANEPRVCVWVRVGCLYFLGVFAPHGSSEEILLNWKIGTDGVQDINNR